MVLRQIGWDIPPGRGLSIWPCSRGASVSVVLIQPHPPPGALVRVVMSALLVSTVVRRQTRVSNTSGRSQLQMGEIFSEMCDVSIHFA